jgi:hypothetical protein
MTPPRTDAPPKALRRFDLALRSFRQFVIMCTVTTP